MPGHGQTIGNPAGARTAGRRGLHGWDMPGGQIGTFSEGTLEGTKVVYLFNDDGTEIERIQLPA